MQGLLPFWEKNQLTLLFVCGKVIVAKESHFNRNRTAANFFRIKCKGLHFKKGEWKNDGNDERCSCNGAGPGLHRDDIPKPVCGDYEALVHVKYCGFCNGTDLHIIDGTMTKEAGLGEYPTVLGHESSGVVVEVGKKVRNIKIGDHYVHINLYPEVGGGYTRHLWRHGRLWPGGRL